jgi:WD40 repeat protein
MKKSLLFALSTVLLSASEMLSPVSVIDINGTAKDLVIHNQTMDIATDMGHIEIYDISTNKKIDEVSIPDVKDFMGDIVPARVMSSDFIDDKYLLLSDSGKGGYSDLFIYQNSKVTQILSADDKVSIIKARFIDKEHILFGFLSNEVALFDLGSKKELYRMQLSESKFSDFALNEDRTKAVFSCESGELSVVDVKSGKVDKILKGLNLDNVYKVDFKKDKISAAGQDRRGSIYNVKSGKGEYIQGNFLIYATALSPSSDLVAFAMNEENDIMIYNSDTKSKKFVLKGQKSTLNSIVFVDEDRLYSASDDSSVMVWNLKEKR